ncbi:penicillin-binding protein 2 [Allohahella marinimesophila]|uniref:Peptidoglycan D,D-transpeptidase MrdA n=1 Tax=Allohahella marinimesophila TaxID=1054972 RepID=A0ABP7NFM3_9GAMM
MSTHSDFKDHRQEQETFLVRAVLALLVILVLTCLLGARYYFLQVNQHEVFETLSDQNRMQLRSVVPTRGLIYDSQGLLLADNQPTFSLRLTAELLGDLDETLATLSSLVAISEDDIADFRKRIRQRRRPYEPVTLRSRLTEDEIATLAVNRYRLKGVDVGAELIRYYPYKHLFAHVLGYVGRISEPELQQVDAANYSGTQYYGKLGIEKRYEDELHGLTGHETIETNARGRVLRQLAATPPAPGKDLKLFLDARLQKTAEDALAGRRGAVVAIDNRTGGILALVSTPSFDPNLFVTGIDTVSYRSLQDSRELPLFNRAYKGQYPPGSTIKPMVALAALDTDKINLQTKVWDPGFYTLKNDKRQYRDWKRQGHGWVDLRTGIVESCDVFFYDTGFKTGVDIMYEYLHQFGLGQRTTYDAPEARKGNLPSRDWKRAARGQSWFPGDSLNMSIGQGFMLMTPLQLATSTAVLANRGRWVTPRLVDTMSGESMTVPESPGNDIVLREDWYWEYIINTMEDVMHTRKGTANRSGRGADYRIAGKTGTAQVIGIKQGEKYDADAIAEWHRDHGLFIGFAPADDPTIAVAVIVENGGGGSTAAAPVARVIFDAHLKGEYEVTEELIDWLLPDGVEQPARPRQNEGVIVPGVAGTAADVGGVVQ